MRLAILPQLYIEMAAGCSNKAAVTGGFGAGWVFSRLVIHLSTLSAGRSRISCRIWKFACPGLAFFLVIHAAPLEDRSYHTFPLHPGEKEGSREHIICILAEDSTPCKDLKQMKEGLRAFSVDLLSLVVSFSNLHVFWKRFIFLVTSLN